MKRRQFMGTSAASLAALGTLPLAGATAPAAAPAAGDGRQFLELQKYTLEKPEQKPAFEKYMRDAFIPTVNKMDCKPVGVFYDLKEVSPIYVLVPHPTLQSAVTLTKNLLADPAFAGTAMDYIDAPKSAPMFKEVESWLMHAFKGIPKVENPVRGPGRIFQLRIYESPSLKTGQKKIEMFNDAGELKLFREVGLWPVFFGEVLFGAKLPNLTYMVGFESEADQKAAWKKFGGHPEWQKMKSMPEYADARIIRNINNYVLKPAPYSQI